VREFYADLSSLRNDLTTLEGDVEALDMKEETLRSDLAAAAETVSELGVLDTDNSDPLEDAEKLFATIESIEEDLDLAQTVTTAQQTVSSRKDDLRDLLAEWNDAPDLTNADSATLVRTVDQFLERGENVTELVEAREQRDGIRVRLQRRLTVSAIEPAFEPYRDSTMTTGRSLRSSVSLRRTLIERQSKNGSIRSTKQSRVLKQSDRNALKSELSLRRNSKS